MKFKVRILIVLGGLLLFAGGLWATRDSTICPIHHVQALATGRVRANGMACEYSHYDGRTGGTHTFWTSCD